MSGTDEYDEGGGEARPGSAGTPATGEDDESAGGPATSEEPAGDASEAAEQFARQEGEAPSG